MANLNFSTNTVTFASYAENAGTALKAVSADYAAYCKGKANSADCDGEGNNIAESYVKKTDMPSLKLEDDALCLVVTYKGRKYKFVGAEVEST